MAAARGDSYSADTGVAVAGGRAAPMSALALAIAAMSANSMAEYTGTNINEMESTNWLGESLGLLETVGNLPLTNWCGKFCWDSQNQMIFGVGTAQGYASHSPAGTRSKAVYFDLSANEFEIQWNPTGKNEGHVYDANSSIPMGGYFYRRSRLSNDIWRMSTPGKVWASWLDTTSFTGTAAEVVAIDAFPDLGASGSLMLLGNTGKLWRYDFATASGSLLTTVSGTATYSVCIYVPSAQKVVFGGGTAGTTLYTIDSSGTIAELVQTLPASVEVAAGSTSGPTVADPTGEALLTFSNGTNKVWRLDMATGTWTELMAFPSGLNNEADMSPATALHGLGAVVLWNGRGRVSGVTASKFWIYKA